MQIREVTQQEAVQIIETREPLGLFYRKCDHSNRHVGIDNLYGHANVEDFETQDECFVWLKGGTEISGELEPVNEKEVYKKALVKWGAVAQVTMVFEEMAELQKELCKSLRGNHVTENIADEIADVEIMIAQMKELFEIEEVVKSRKEFKLRKLHNNVKDIQMCRVCGCTWNNACDGGCYWAEEDLCSECVGK